MWGPRPRRPGGKGLQMREQRGSIGREQVAAFRTPGEPSPHPSVTACPPPQCPIWAPGSSELRGASW